MKSKNELEALNVNVVTSFVTWIIIKFSFVLGVAQKIPKLSFMLCLVGFMFIFSSGVPITLDILRYKSVTTVISVREITDYSIVKAIHQESMQINTETERLWFSDLG